MFLTMRTLTNKTRLNKLQTSFEALMLYVLFAPVSFSW